MLGKSKSHKMARSKVLYEMVEQVPTLGSFLLAQEKSLCSKGSETLDVRANSREVLHVSP